MSNTIKQLLVLSVFTLSASAFAGGKGYACKADTQTCLGELATSLKSKGWMGVEYDWDSKTSVMAVKRVVAGSPAEAAKFQAGDVVLAINGIKVGQEETKKQLKALMVPEAKLTYTVKRAGVETALVIKLAPMPPEVLAQIVGEHMLEHHVKAEIAKK